MAKSVSAVAYICVGLLAPMVFVATSCRAQEAAPQAAPIQGQPAAPVPVPACAGLGCLFSGGAQQAQAQPQPVSPAPAPVQEPAPTAQPVVDAPIHAIKPKPKPVRPVTIAAQASDFARLNTLVAAMPKGKVKIVATSGPEADFSVATALDQREGSEKARLYTEQLHIVAVDGVHSIADLKDKVVSFGADKSPSQAAARKAFEALNIPVKETPLDLDNALDGLSTGDIAAVVVLAPQPVARFEKLTTPGLHLVSWPQDGTLPAGAVAATIDGARYPGLAKSREPIRAMGVDAVLKISAKGSHDAASRAFLTALSQHSAALSKRGFDLLRADLASRAGRRFASDEAR